MPRLTVIGGSGFLGRNLIARLDGWSVTSFDRVPFPCDAKRPSEFREVIGDTAEGSKLDEACNAADVIFIRAGLAGGQKSVEASLLPDYLASNCEMVRSVLASAERSGCQRIIFDSSEQVWGTSADQSPQQVGEEPIAANFYGASKSIAEKLLHLWAMQSGRSVQVFRYSRVRAAATRDVIYHMVKSSCEGKPLRVLVDPNHSISFVHVDDVVRANLKALTLAPQFAIYQVSCDRPYTVLEIAELIRSITVSRSEIRIEPPARGLPFEPFVTGMRWRESAARLGCEPKYTLSSMVQETAALIRSEAVQ